MSDNAQRGKPRKVSASGKDAERPIGRRRSGSAVESGPAVPAVRTAPGSAEMIAMVLRTDRSIGLERRPVPTLRDDQVLVDVDLCGICGSDLHSPQTPEVYLGGFIMGHEPVGRIARVGRDVTGWHVGQRVCINPNGDTCGVCEACRLHPSLYATAGRDFAAFAPEALHLARADAGAVLKGGTSKSVRFRHGTADVIAVASMSLANPDLVERIKTNAPLNAPDPSTFYGGGTKGYTDYPTLAMTAHQ